MDLIMKKIVISVLLIFTITISNCLAYTISFSDIDNHWAKNNIQTLAKEKIISGYSDGTFRPNNSITRAEFIKLLISTVVQDGYFTTDYGKYNHWASSYIEEAEARGIIYDNEINEKNANKAITRGDVARIIGLADIVILENEQEACEVELYDIGSVDDATYSMLTHCVATGLILGYDDASYKPEKALTRAEVATLLTRLLDRVEE